MDDKLSLAFLEDSNLPQVDDKLAQEAGKQAQVDDKWASALVEDDKLPQVDRKLLQEDDKLAQVLLEDDKEVHIQAQDSLEDCSQPEVCEGVRIPKLEFDILASFEDYNSDELEAGI